VLYLLTL
jgi:amino acid transporter